VPLKKSKSRLDDTNEDDLSVNTTDPMVKLDRIKQFVDLVQLENREAKR
ncbi:24355_t:CDS:1, partial [Gigaspora margarita]